MTYHRIDKRVARKLYAEDKSFYMIARKMRPGLPFQMGMTIFPAACKEENAMLHRTADAGFDSMVANFVYYNCSYETGYYPAFYLEKES